ncbi:MAG: ketoacyl-ACP synthase III [Planctomycetota bacterium]|nr:ketoacyl-ACP synthase III [Planctomycetota bacterium]
MKATLNRSVAILGTGRFLPARVVTNPILRDLCSNYDEDASGDFSTWVDRVTHIHERRYVDEEETSGHIGAEAGKRALEMAGVKATELDLIIFCSFTPAACVPGDHVLVADLLGANATPSFTLTAACAGSVQGMALAYGMIASGTMRRILVIGAETISPTLDYADPLTAILFADGAGAVVMGAVDATEGGMLPPYLGFEFNWENITMNNANLPFRTTVRVPAQDGCPPAIEKTYLKMVGGRSVLRNAVNTMAGAVRRVLGYENGAIPAEDFEAMRPRLRVVPHQANGRIVDGLTKKLGIAPERMLKTVHLYGNVSAASNLIALDFSLREGNLVADSNPETGKINAVNTVNEKTQKGDLLVLPSIGAGYLFGAIGFVNTI